MFWSFYRSKLHKLCTDSTPDLRHKIKMANVINMPNFTLQQESKCPTCLELINKGNSVLYPCGHGTCEECHAAVLEHESDDGLRCCVCRAPFQKDGIEFHYYISDSDDEEDDESMRSRSPSPVFQGNDSEGNDSEGDQNNRINQRTPTPYPQLLVDSSQDSTGLPPSPNVPDFVVYMIHLVNRAREGEFDPNHYSEPPTGLGMETQCDGCGNLLSVLLNDNIVYNLCNEAYIREYNLRYGSYCGSCAQDMSINQ